MSNIRSTFTSNHKSIAFTKAQIEYQCSASSFAMCSQFAALACMCSFTHIVFGRFKCTKMVINLRESYNILLPFPCVDFCDATTSLSVRCVCSVCFSRNSDNNLGMAHDATIHLP